MTFKQLCDWAPLSSFFTKDTLSGQQYYYYYYYYYYYTRIHNAPTFSSDRLLNRRRLLMLKRLTIRYCSPTLVLSNYMINGCRV